MRIKSIVVEPSEHFTCCRNYYNKSDLWHIYYAPIGWGRLTTQHNTTQRKPYVSMMYGVLCQLHGITNTIHQMWKFALLLNTNRLNVILLNHFMAQRQFESDAWQVPELYYRVNSTPYYIKKTKLMQLFCLMST